MQEFVTVAIYAVICGADKWTEVAQFGQAKGKWSKSFLRLPNCIPSHDTFGRVFGALNPEALERCFLSWIKALAGAENVDLIAIDGKTLWRSFDRASNKAAFHMISAWACANKFTLGQLATGAKSNGITAIPKLLELLDLKGCTVTIDAMGCQKKLPGRSSIRAATTCLPSKATKAR